jgi:signal transduction histidine kinase
LLFGLCVLAGVQYRWISQVAEAERERTRANLSAALAGLESDFDIEITRAFVALQVPFPELDYAERYKEWLRRAPYPNLIRGVYIMRAGQADSLPEAVIPGEPPIRSAEWQRDLPLLRPTLDGGPVTAAVSGAIGLQAFSRSGVGVTFVSTNSEVTIDGNPAFIFPLLPSGPGFESPRLVSHGADKHLPFKHQEIVNFGVQTSLPSWAILVFDANYISTSFLPKLVQRHFGSGWGSDYDILVLQRNGTASPRAVFPPALATPESKFARPDGKIILFQLRLDCFSPTSSTNAPAVANNRPQLRMLAADSFSEIWARKPTTCSSPAPTRVNSPGPPWEMLVRYRAGSLDQAMATFRHRNLILSGSVLVALGLAISMVVLLTERARALAEMQAEFVLGVSHELRTPLTVIRVAADNLERGMVQNSEQAQKYGQIIHNQAAELSNMVEETLALARMHSIGLTRHGAVFTPAQIVRTALADNESALRNAGMKVQVDLAPDLPPIYADIGLLKKCLDNLIQNAVKYGSAGRWVAIRTQKVISKEGERIQISVEDQGAGISPDDLPHLFEPFYRGHRDEVSLVPGIGLGLTLVRRVVEAHGGTVEVESGNVTRFSIFLPPHSLRPDEQEAV